MSERRDEGGRREEGAGRTTEREGLGEAGRLNTANPCREVHGRSREREAGLAERRTPRRRERRLQFACAAQLKKPLLASYARLFWWSGRLLQGLCATADRLLQLTIWLLQTCC